MITTEWRIHVVALLGLFHIRMVTVVHVGDDDDDDDDDMDDVDGKRNGSVRIVI